MIGSGAADLHHDCHKGSRADDQQRCPQIIDLVTSTACRRIDQFKAVLDYLLRRPLRRGFRSRVDLKALGGQITTEGLGKQKRGDNKDRRSWKSHRNHAVEQAPAEVRGCERHNHRRYAAKPPTRPYRTSTPPSHAGSPDRAQRSTRRSQPAPRYLCRRRCRARTSATQSSIRHRAGCPTGPYQRGNRPKTARVQELRSAAAGPIVEEAIHEIADAAD